MPGESPLPRDVQLLLDDLLPATRGALTGNLIAVYVRGSLTDGSFVERVSDVDLLAVTDHPLTEPEFAALTTAHARMARIPNPYAEEVEIPYIDRAAARRFEPGRRHPTLYRHEHLAWAEHRENWVLERWVVRERGITLIGPDPRTLIDVVTAEDVRAAVRADLAHWAEWARDPEEPGWVHTRGHSAYVVETMCRALDTLASGALHSKRHAVDWAMQTLPERWQGTLRRSQNWRVDPTPDPTIIPEVMTFVAWAAAVGTATDDGGNARRRGGTVT